MNDPRREPEAGSPRPSVADEVLEKAGRLGREADTDEDLRRAHDEVALDEHVNRRDLRRIVGVGALALGAIQIAIADAVFVAHAFAVDWRLSNAAIAAWMSATVVEVIAVVLVIARSLFPSAPDDSGA